MSESPTPKKPRKKPGPPKHAKLSSRLAQKRILPAAVRYLVWDEDNPGLGLDVWPSGTRSWIIFYRVNGRPRRVVLGDSELLTHEQALRKARAIRAAADEGRDAFEERRQRAELAVAEAKARREAPTFADVAERYLEYLRGEHKSKKWIAEATRILNAEILPYIGDKLVADLGVREVKALHIRMSDRPFLANRAKAIVSAVIRIALDEEDRPPTLPNPAKKVENYKEKPRKRALGDDEWEALARAWPVLREELADVPEWDTRPTQLRVIELLALTGARVGAVLPRKVGDLAPDHRTMAVSPSHKYVDHFVLGSAAVRTVEALIEGREPSEYLFPGQRRKVGARKGRGTADGRAAKQASPLSSVTPAWNRLREIAGVKNLRLHDLRKSFATIGVGEPCKLTPFVVGVLLGHSAKGVTQEIYIHVPKADPLLLSAADAISEEVSMRLGFTERPAPVESTPAVTD